MTVELAAEIPCTELKLLGDLPNVQLLGGVELKAFVDLAGGPPTDCKLSMNLLIQLAPLLASMACLFKLLDVMAKLLDCVKGGLLAPLPLVTALEELTKCMPPLQIPHMRLMLKTMLQLVLRFLSCFLTQMNTLLEFRASLDFDAAEGNPVLRESLTCARNSADAAQANLLKSLEPLMPVMNIVGIVAGIAGVPLTLPNFAAMSAAGDASASLHSVNEAIDTLQTVVNAIPG